MMVRCRYSEFIFRVWWGRRVVVIWNGYVCFILRYVKFGDVVWLIDGVLMLYVFCLWEMVDGGWEFVGDCYVYGVMNGSVVVVGGFRKMVKFV